MRIEASAAGIVLCVVLASPVSGGGGVRRPVVDLQTALAITVDGDFVLGGTNLARFAPNGNRRWLISLESGEYEHRVQFLGAAASGDIMAGGTFNGDLAIGSTRLHSSGRMNIFLAALSAEGMVRWAISLAGPEDEQLADLAVRGDGSVVISGAFEGAMTIGRTTLGAPIHEFRAFLAAFSPKGEPLWARAFDAASPLLKAAGDRLAFVTSFHGTADLGAGPLTAEGKESETALGFLDAAGKTVWAKRLGGPSSPASLAVDQQGNLLVLASTNSDLRVGERWLRIDIDACFKAGAVLASFSGDGAVRWARGWGISSSGGTSAWIAVDHSGSVLVGGSLEEVGGIIRWEGNPRDVAPPAGEKFYGHWEGYVLTFSPDGRPGQAVLGNWAFESLGRPAIDRHDVSFVLASLPNELPIERLGPDFGLQLKAGNIVVLRVAPASKIAARRRDEERAAARRFPWLARRPAWATSPPGHTDIDFGQSLAYLGDVDGDHVGDVAIGAPRANSAWIYFGGAKGFRKSATALRPPPGVRKGFGARLTALGDLNADGRPDLAVFAGAPVEPGGRLAVYFGAAGGPSPNAGWVMSPLETKETPVAVAAADLDGDGAPELIVGVPRARKGRGRVLVYRGGSTGPSATPAWTLDGPKPEASFGAALAVCDVNHDGIADLIVGAPGAEPEEGGPDAGRLGAVYLYLGGKAGPPPTSAWSYQSHAEWFGLGAALACPGDVDGDGKPDLIAAHPWSEIEGGDIWSGQVHLFSGTGAGFSKEPTWSVDIGAHSVTLVPAGDVNGDGLADFLVGASPVAGDGDSRVDLYLGGRPGPAKVADWSIGSRDPGFGIAVASGDVNGDGVRDVLVGDPEHSICVRHPNIGKAQVESTAHGQVEVYLGHR